MVVHKRGGPEVVEHAWVGMPVSVGDVIETGPETEVAIGFIIGGRVGINRNATVRIAAERSVEDAEFDGTKFLMRKGGMWEKTAKLKEPLEIQYSGGVMGGLKG